jgi:hypothetical protein
MEAALDRDHHVHGVASSTRVKLLGSSDCQGHEKRVHNNRVTCQPLAALEIRMPPRARGRDGRTRYAAQLRDMSATGPCRMWTRHGGGIR